MNSAEHRVRIVQESRYEITETEDGTYSDRTDLAMVNHVSNQALDIAIVTLNAIAGQRVIAEDEKSIDADPVYTPDRISEPEDQKDTHESALPLDDQAASVSNETKDDLNVSMEIIDTKKIDDDDDTAIISTQSLSLLRESIIDREAMHTRSMEQTKLANPTHMGLAKALKYFVVLIGILAPFAIMPFELQARDQRNPGLNSSHSDNTLGMALGIALLAIVVIGTVVGYRTGKKKSSHVNEELSRLTDKILRHQSEIRQELARIFHILVDKSPEELEWLLTKVNKTRATAIASSKGIKGVRECILKIKRIQVDKSVAELIDFFGSLTDHEISNLVKDLMLDAIQESTHIGTIGEKMRGCCGKTKQYLSHACEGGSNVYATGLTGI